MKNSIELLRAEVEMKQHEIRKLQDQVTDKQSQQRAIEIDPDDYSSEYDEVLDESGNVEIAGYFFNPSHALQVLDPTAYRCGLNDFVDSLDVEDTDDYKALQEEIDQLQSDIEDLENEIEDLENQIADLNE